TGPAHEEPFIERPPRREARVGANRGPDNLGHRRMTILSFGRRRDPGHVERLVPVEEVALAHQQAPLVPKRHAYGRIELDAAASGPSGTAGCAAVVRAVDAIAAVGAVPPARAPPMRLASGRRAARRASVALAGARRD